VTTNVYSLKIGAVRITVVPDAISPLTEDRIIDRFPNITDEQLAHFRSIPDQGSAMNTAVFESGGPRMLIDTGMGAKHKPTHGHLLDRLAEAGIAPESIDIVFITHFHGDHVSGVLDENGGVNFPNAEIVVSSAEKAAYDAGVFPNPAVKAMIDGAGSRLRMVEDGTEVIPNVRTHLMTGHSPGHTGLVVESQGEKLLHVVDTLHYLVQMRYPNLSPTFDYDPTLAALTRRGVLGQAADEGWTVLAYHLPFPGVGTVTRDGDGFVWHGVNVP